MCLKKLYSDMYLFWNTNTHYAPHNPFFSVNIDQTLVNSHFPLIPRGSAFATRRLQNRNLQPLCRKRNWTVHFDPCLLSDSLQFTANTLQFHVVCAGQTYPCFPNQCPSFLLLCSRQPYRVFTLDNEPHIKTYRNK